MSSLSDDFGNGSRKAAVEMDVKQAIDYIRDSENGGSLSGRLSSQYNRVFHDEGPAKAAVFLSKILSDKWLATDFSEAEEADRLLRALKQLPGRLQFDVLVGSSFVQILCESPKGAEYAKEIMDLAVSQDFSQDDSYNSSFVVKRNATDLCRAGQTERVLDFFAQRTSDYGWMSWLLEKADLRDVIRKQGYGEKLDNVLVDAFFHQAPEVLGSSLGHAFADSNLDNKKTAPVLLLLSAWETEDTLRKASKELIGFELSSGVGARKILSRHLATRHVLKALSDVGASDVAHVLIKNLPAQERAHIFSRVSDDPDPDVSQALFPLSHPRNSRSPAAKR